MKLSIPIVFATAAGLANAAPLVLIYAAKPRPAPEFGGWAQNVRWGHAAANAEFLPPIMTAPSPTSYHYNPTPIPDGWARIMTAPNPTYLPRPTGTQMSYLPDPTPNPEWIAFGERLRAEIGQEAAARKGGCRMRKMRNKSLQWGNKLRVILGLPPIEELRDSFHGMRPIMFETQYRDGRIVSHKQVEDRWLKPTHHRHHMRPLHHAPPFYVRLAHALSSLGPWEGRAVSFVLGCGLGVLLRMLFVFGVLIVRGVRCRRAERRIALVGDSVLFIADVKEPVVVETLPAYAEKVETAETEEVPQTNNAH